MTTEQTQTRRRARDAAAVSVITDAIASAPPQLLPAHVARLVLGDLRRHGLFDHTCDDLCGTEPDDHHVCGEDGHPCDDECMCHGYSNDDEAEPDAAR